MQNKFTLECNILVDCKALVEVLGHRVECKCHSCQAGLKRITDLPGYQFVLENLRPLKVLYHPKIEKEKKIQQMDRSLLRIMEN